MSSALNVVRWTTLVGGAVYGVVHGRTLQKEYDSLLSYRHEQWKTQSIKDAHHKFIESKKPKSSGPISDPDDPAFDVDKYIEFALKE